MKKLLFGAVIMLLLLSFPVWLVVELTRDNKAPKIQEVKNENAPYTKTVLSIDNTDDAVGTSVMTVFFFPDVVLVNN